MITVDNPNDGLLVERLFREGQEHVFRFWDEINQSSRNNLLNQLRNIDWGLLKELRKKCLGMDKRNREKLRLKPPQILPIPSTEDQKIKAKNAKAVGEEAIRQGKVAAFLVAGGQGTRLGFDGPKGCFPMGPVTGKSIFQMHSEKILAAVRKYDTSIPWYIMTSETNDSETRDFFRNNHFFGLGRENVFFFKQRMIAALDEAGKLILDRKDHIFENPNGHGGSLLALVESGAIDDMKRRGVEIISYFQVDNVLIKIIDPLFIGYHIQERAEMSSKMVRKRTPDEKVGVFGMVDGRLHVIEYSDMTEEEMHARDGNGNLKYGAGNVAIHLITVPFVEQEVSDEFKLPYHVAHKKIAYLNQSGSLIHPEKPNGYKFETFVFDALGDTSRSVVMEVSREEEFSPVKNREGEDSPCTGRRDLIQFFRKWLEEAGVPVPRNQKGDVMGSIEISPLFAINKQTFLQKIPAGMRFKDSLYLGPQSLEDV